MCFATPNKRPAAPQAGANKGTLVAERLMARAEDALRGKKGHDVAEVFKFAAKAVAARSSNMGGVVNATDAFIADFKL
jgi:hypothetical protein